MNIDEIAQQEGRKQAVGKLLVNYWLRFCKKSHIILFTSQYNARLLALDRSIVENHFLQIVAYHIQQKELTMCISEETVFIMDQDVSAISKIFLTELLRKEYAADSATPLKEPIAASSDTGSRAGHHQEAALPA